MGKLQENERSAIGVKREVVSASAHLEVISQESFVWRLEGMSSNSSSSSSCGQSSSAHATASCANCQKERTRSAHNNNNNNSSCSNSHHSHNHKATGRRGKLNRRKQQQQQQQHQHNQQQPQVSSRQNSSAGASKANAPIVIHLKDTLNSGFNVHGRGRQSSLEDHDSDVSRSTDEDQSSTSSGSSSGRSGGGGRRRGLRGRGGFYNSSPLYRSAVSPFGRGRFSSEMAWSHIYEDVASIPEFVPNSYYHVPHHHSQLYLPHYYPHYHQPWPLQPSYYHPSRVMSPLAASDLLSRGKMPSHRLRDGAQKAKEKSRKNLTALISVIEKAHRKEPTEDIEPNLSHNSAPDAKLSGSILNNVSSAGVSSRPHNDAELKKRNMAECDNVELICNDLSAAESPRTTYATDGDEERNGDKMAMSESSSATTDDSDQSDKASVASSSDTLSDDLVAELLPALDGREISPVKLHQLAQYTTGVPLMRYGSSPHHHPAHACHQCSAWYSHSQGYQHDVHFDEEPYIQRCSLYHQQRGIVRPQPRHKLLASSRRISISSDSDVSSDIDDSASTSSSESSAASSGTERAVAATHDSEKRRGSSADLSSNLNDHPCASNENLTDQTSPANPEPPVSRNPETSLVSSSSPASSTSAVTTTTTTAKTTKESSPVKRAVASWKVASQAARSTRQLWDIDVWPASRRRASRHYAQPYHHHYGHPAHQHHLNHYDDDGPPFADSVFLDVTGLDVTIEVTYHNQADRYSHHTACQAQAESLGADTVQQAARYHSHEGLPQESAASTAWPYPVHSLFQALYSPTVTAPVQGIQLPLLFNNTVFYPLKADTAPPVQLKKYEMSIPPLRPWIPIGGPDKDVPSAVFSTMCYNVLCDKLCTKTMYGYCPTWALSWDYRKKGIMRDILRGNTDIITLQEVETEQYHSMFYPELAQQGYDGVFLPKSRVRTMNLDKEKKAVDGCAIFFRKSKFEKVNEYHVEFNQLATREGASNTDTDMINRVSTKDNIAIVAVLRTKAGAYEDSPVPAPKGFSQLLMVSTAHIHWDPALPDVKLVQTMMLVEELQKFVREASMQFRPNAPPPSMDAADLCNSMPLILCGDFNSLPDSGVYEYLSKGRLDTRHQDFEGQNYQVFMKDRHDNGVISHNFKLSSAYKDVIPFTNYTFDFKGIIDYVFYSDAHLRLHGVMGLQDEEWFRANKIIGCPHPYVPSDHFPLFAEFSLPARSAHPTFSGSGQGPPTISISSLPHRGPR